MKILFLVPYIPNLIRVRPYNLICHLAAQGHDVTLLTLWTNEREYEEAKELGKRCTVEALPLPRWQSYWNCLAALPSRTPLQAVYCWQPQLFERLSRLAGSSERGGPAFDVLHIEHLRGVRYGIHLKGLIERQGIKLPLVWDSVDCISLLFRQAASRSKSFFGRWMTLFELRRTERYEAKAMRFFERALVTSKADRQALLSLLPQSALVAGIEVLPNGVDLDYFRPDLDTPKETQTLVVSGKMSYHANVTMVLYLARELMPRIWARRPDVRLDIVGKDPPEEIVKLALNPAVRVTGTVEDLRPYLRRASVAVAPITYGVGIQNKVLEAMACGTAVVTTPQAVSALEVQNEKEVLVAQDAEDFCRAVLSLLDEPVRRQQLEQAGRAYVEKRHHWGDITSRLAEIYSESKKAVSLR